MVPSSYFALIGEIFGLWWLWLLVAAGFGFFAWRNYQRAKNLLPQDNVLLLLEIPRTNDKKELAAEQMFASLHGILRSRKEIIKEGSVQEHISFEFASIGQRIRFYISLPRHLQAFVEGQVYAQYPTVQIYELTEDYAARDLTQPVVYTAEITTTGNEVLPIKTFPNFDVDPLAAITATLAKLGDQEEMWVQILARPIDDSWHLRGSRYIESLKSGGGLFSGSFGGLGWLTQVFAALAKPPEAGSGGSGSTVADLSERDKTRIRAVEEKTTKLGYQVKMRVVYLGLDKTTARLRMQAMMGTFKQFNTTNLNGFAQDNASYDPDRLAEYRARHFIDGGRILNIEELASVYHLPHTTVETPNIVWATSKTAEPPSNLPTVDSSADGELSAFGLTNFRGTNIQFGIKRADRSRHLYIVGQTGTGKSGLLELLTLSDIFHNEGFAVIDPHGDYASSVLRYIPAHRIDDVVYFNPADREFPIGFNPLEVSDPTFKNHISSELVGVLKRMFESWGPRLEYILRYTILALLDYPNATMLDITRMLTERDFRNDVISHVQDPVVRNFWTVEFASWNDKFAAEAVAPVLNKVGAFTANPMIRNIIGQPKSTINLRQIMDEGKILIVNLSRGLVGEDNAAILGAMIVTKIQLAAMSRADIPNIADRRRFYLYVDEFQNFATDSFAVILSEARKYALNLTVANQYVSQMSPIVRDAVFGNVGSMISFRVGADDGTALQKYYEPQFMSQDLIQLHNRHFVIGMAIDGEKAPAFSATSLNIPPPQADHSAVIIDHSRTMYALTREEVEKRIESTHLALKSPVQRQQPSGQGQPRGHEHRETHKEQNTNNQSQSQSGNRKPNRGRNQERRGASHPNSHQSDPKKKSAPEAAKAAEPKAGHGKLEDDTTISLR